MTDDFWTPTTAVFIVVLIMGAAISNMVQIKKQNTICFQNLYELGYTKGDINIYLKMTDISPCDLRDSSALLKHFDRFIDGEMTEFTNISINKKQQEEAENSARNAGMVTGLVVGANIR